MACRIYALAQQKGGVGKTTTVINLGAALRERKRRVLLIDLDPQGALAAGLGLDPLALDSTVYDVLRSARSDLAGVIRQTDSGCDLAPANIDLAAAEIELVSEPGREQIPEMGTPESSCPRPASGTLRRARLSGFRACPTSGSPAAPADGHPASRRLTAQLLRTLPPDFNCWIFAAPAPLLNY